jgi:hypothetical protein
MSGWGGPPRFEAAVSLFKVWVYSTAIKLPAIILGISFASCCKRGSTSVEYMSKSLHWMTPQLVGPCPLHHDCLEEKVTAAVEDHRMF